MQAFHIRYRNTQGTLMRILNAASRRGLDLGSVHAEGIGQDHHVTLRLEVSQKHMGQLCREWHAIADVTEVRSVGVAREQSSHDAWAVPHPPASTSMTDSSAQAALA
jgi:acetolactate synthase small subunit